VVIKKLNNKSQITKIKQITMTEIQNSKLMIRRYLCEIASSRGSKGKGSDKLRLRQMFGSLNIVICNLVLGILDFKLSIHPKYYLIYE